MEQLIKSVALLIDAENISPKYIGLIVDEANKYGNLNYRRIYGDWTDSKLNSWKKACLNNALTPIQQFHSASGKNSSDFSLVIDAMDILNSGKVSGFCIVSSDGDFAKLITRIKEDDMIVYGMGEEKTPISLVNTYESFVYLDKMYKLEQQEEKAKKLKEAKELKEAKLLETKTTKTAKAVTKKVVTKSKAKDTSITPQKRIVGYMKMLINQASDENGLANYSRLMALFKKKYPGFHPRNYGQSMRTFEFWKSQKEFNTKIVNGVHFLSLATNGVKK